MLLHWFITFWGNLAGSLFVMAIIIGYGGTFSATLFHARVITFATAKAITPAWHQVFLRGIGANWLVCLAAYLSFMGREFFSKVVGIWWPTFAFVMLGFDHVVANMFYIPLGIFVGTPGLSVGHYIAYSMIPALLGNIVGGGLFVGVVYWYLVSLSHRSDADARMYVLTLTIVPCRGLRAKRYRRCILRWRQASTASDRRRATGRHTL
jgi:formate/nitrite transporter